MYIYKLGSSIKLSRLFRILTTSSFAILLALSYVFLNPTNNIITTFVGNITGTNNGVYADDTPATSGTPFPSLVTLNIDLTHPNASVELTPHDSTGTFSSSSEDDSVAFNVSTNNYTGYTLYLSSPASSGNDSSMLTNTNTALTTNNTLSSIEQITTESDFSSTSSTNLNNKWGYKPSKYNGSDNTSYVPAPTITNPTTNSAILDTTTTYNTTTTGDPITTETNTEDINANTYTIGLGARVDSTVATGSYEGTFVLQVVGNPVPVTITYTDTSGDASVTSTLPSVYHGELSDTEAPISTTTPTRTGYTFKSWCLGTVTAGTSSNNYVDTCTGTTYNPSTAQNTQYIGVDLTHSNTMTLVAMWEVISCDNTKLCVQYNGNGLNFDRLPFNRVNYDSNRTFVNMTKYSHTANISDNGTRSGNYASGLNTNDVVTIPGAATMHIKLTYGTEYWDKVYVFQGEHTGNWSSYESNARSFSDYEDSPRTVEMDISGDTVTFGFYSVGSYRQFYGYYAVITGVSRAGSRTVSSGGYSAPSGTDAVFYGWSTTPTTPGAGLPSAVEYVDEAAVKTDMVGNNGEVKTLYAVWQQKSAITFVKDGNVSSIAVLDANNNTVGTITSSGQSVSLLGGSTYFILPSYNTNYAMNTVTRTNGVGTVTKLGNNAEFVVGVGSATINITSKRPSAMQNYNCSSLAIGGTDVVYDTRDNTHYSIGKLADNKCWMLDNLALGSTSSITLTNSNTNMSASSWTLPASTSNTFNDSFTAPMIFTTDENTYAALGGEQVGVGKIGVYYNYCAATAGTYCMAEKSETGNASYDICPKGWRMPTGGSNGEHKVLRDRYSSVAEFAHALRPVKSGHRSGTSVTFRGSYGDIWSSTLYSTTIKRMSNLEVGSTSVDTNNWVYGYRDYGLSIRCIRNS